MKRESRTRLLRALRVLLRGTAGPILLAVLVLVLGLAVPRGAAVLTARDDRNAAKIGQTARGTNSRRSNVPPRVVTMNMGLPETGLAPEPAIQSLFDDENSPFDEGLSPCPARVESALCTDLGRVAPTASHVPTASAAVTPEPATLGLLAIGSLVALRRKRRFRTSIHN